MRILIYGFKAYGPYAQNISEQVINRLPDKRGIKKRIFEVSFDYDMFYNTFNSMAPDIIIGLGQHPRARKIRIERKARNCMKGEDGAIQKIKAGTPLLRYANLILPRSPVTTVTYDAGSYVCNFSMFLTADYSARSGSRFVFLHLPMAMKHDVIASYIERSCEILQDSAK